MKRERVIELWLAGFVLVAGLIVVVVLLGTAAADGPPMSERAPLSYSPAHNLLPTNNVYAFGHLGVVGNIIKRNNFEVDPLCNEQDGCYPYGDGCEERDYYCMGDEEGCNYTSSNRHTDGWVDTGNTRWVDTGIYIVPVVNDMAVTKIDGDTICVSLKLLNIPSTLVFNQDFVPDNSLEYEWSIYIDLDNNPSTGSSYPEGCEVSISLMHFKFPGSTQHTDTIIGGTQHSTWIFNRGWQYGHTIDATVDYSTNTIKMIASKAWEELSDFEETDRFCFLTSYQYASGEVCKDITSFSDGSNIITDLEGDVPYNFIDIIQGSSNSSMPDLVITDKWVCWPDNCTICYNVKNIGNEVAPACHNTTLYVEGVEVAHDHVPVDLAPGESYTGCFDDYTWTYTPPRDNITVCADNDEAVDELDKTNNCVTNIWMCGDVNCDGKVTMSDVRKVFNRYLDPNYPLDLPWAADVNCDGKVTMSDVRKVFNRYLDPGYVLNCCCGSGVDSAWVGG